MPTARQGADGAIEAVDLNRGCKIDACVTQVTFAIAAAGFTGGATRSEVLCERPNTSCRSAATSTTRCSTNRRFPILSSGDPHAHGPAALSTRRRDLRCGPRPGAMDRCPHQNPRFRRRLGGGGLCEGRQQQELGRLLSLRGWRSPLSAPLCRHIREARSVDGCPRPGRDRAADLHGRYHDLRRVRGHSLLPGMGRPQGLVDFAAATLDKTATGAAMFGVFRRSSTASSTTTCAGACGRSCRTSAVRC